MNGYELNYRISEKQTQEAARLILEDGLQLFGRGFGDESQ